MKCKLNKSEIEQLKEQAEYESFMSMVNPQIEVFQQEISSLKPSE